MTRPRWKKPDARKTIESLADTVADAFAVDRPTVGPGLLERGPNDWKFRFDSPLVWTTCGAGRLSVDISPTFAHLYFCFDDVARAVESLHYAAQRLNPCSGKWNLWEAAPTPLLTFARDVTASFHAVAETEPTPEELDACRLKKERDAAHWAAMRADFAAAQLEKENAK